ncbi:MAG TPA: SPOR domain-containing protein [Stellaceae bacterium]|nr:SPOR domain-containing protein [Stellaceae bacterium]
MQQTLSEFDERDDGYGLMGEERAEEYARPARRLPAILFAVAAMAIFAGGLWFAYVQGTRHAAATSGAPGASGGDGVPLIRADGGPTKVKPDQPGGMKIPDQNVSVYNEKPGGPPVESLLPAPEQPLPRPAPAAESPPPAAAAPAPPAAAPAAAPPQPAVAAIEAPPAAAQPAAKPAAREAPPDHVAKGAAGGPIRLRLASLRSAEAARDEWARLKRDNADLLGKLTAVAIRTDLGDKGIYYRVEAGAFSDAGAAERLCGELKRRQLGCILAR